MGINNSDSINVIFSVDDAMLLISGKYVSDIVPLPEIKMEVPHSPAYISGICNSYNRNITMINLSILLGLHNSGISDKESEMMIIISRDSRKIGLLADKVLSIDSSDNILRHGKNPFASQFISNLCVLKSTDEIAMELDIPEVLSKL